MENKSGKENPLRIAWTSFAAVSPVQRIVVLTGLTIAGIVELFGLTVIIPLLAIMDSTAPDDLGGRKAAIGAFMESALASFGLPMNLTAAVISVMLFLSMRAGIGILVTRHVAKVMADINTAARLKVIRTLMQAQWGFYTRQRLNSLVAAAGHSSNAAGDAFQVSAELITALLQILIYLLICSLIAPTMVPIAIVVVAIMAVTHGTLVRNSKRAAKSERIAMSRMRADLTDVFVGIKSIRAMGRQAQMATLLSNDSDTLDERMKSQVVSAEYAEQLQVPLIGGCLLLGLVGGKNLLGIGGHELLLVALLLVRLVSTFSFVQRSAQRLMSARVRWRTAHNLVSLAEASQERLSGTLVPAPQAGIRFEQVSFRHVDGRMILADADLAIAPGAVTVIVGSSGMGKTTVLDLITGLLTPSSGRILLGGIEHGQVDLSQWRRMIGYVPQDVTLFHDTIRNNVTLGEATYDDEQVWTALRAAGVDAFIRTLPQGLDHVVGERGQMISGGQRQRVALARALLHQPAILVLDEATAGLDLETETGICARIREMSMSEGLTVLAVSHGETWQSFADTVYRMMDGTFARLERRVADPTSLDSHRAARIA